MHNELIKRRALPVTLSDDVDLLVHWSNPNRILTALSVADFHCFSQPASSSAKHKELQRLIEDFRGGFHFIPSGSRAYVMKNIIHDWNDAQTCEILRNCRRAVPDDGVLVLIEYCLGEETRRLWQDGRPRDADDHGREGADG